MRVRCNVVRGFALVISTAVLATACGSGTDGSLSPVTTAVVVQGAPATQAPSVTAALSTTEVLDVEARSLSDVLDGPVQVDGTWPLPPGTWVSDAFDEPVAFTTTRELSLLADGRGAVYLRDPAVSSLHEITLADAAFIPRDAGSVPIPATPEGITEELSEGTFGSLLASGMLEGSNDIHWWDYALGTGDPAFGWPCVYGGRCQGLVRTVGGEQIVVRVDQPTRIYNIGQGDLGLGLYIVGAEDDRDLLHATAEEIALTATTAAETSPSSTRFARSLGSTGEPIVAGGWVQAIGTGALTLEPAADTEVLAAYVGPRTIFAAPPSGNVGIVDAEGLVPSDVAQGTPLDELYGDSRFVEAFGWTNSEYEAWLTELAVVTDSGTVTHGEVEFAWWDITVDESVDSSPCDTFRTADGLGRCVDLFAQDLAWFVASTQPTRLYYSADAGLMMKVVAERDGATMDQVLAELQPVLSTLRFDPAR